MIPDPYNDREFRILALLSEGYQLKEICKKIGLRPTYTRQLTMEIRKKADAKTNAHLVAIAFRNGWIT